MALRVNSAGALRPPSRSYALSAGLSETKPEVEGPRPERNEVESKETPLPLGSDRVRIPELPGHCTVKPVPLLAVILLTRSVTITWRV